MSQQPFSRPGAVDLSALKRPAGGPGRPAAAGPPAAGGGTPGAGAYVVEVTEESFAMAECFEEGADCPLIGECDLNSALREALGAFFEVLDSYTIADLASKKRSIRERLGLYDLDAPVLAEVPGVEI